MVKNLVFIFFIFTFISCEKENIEEGLKTNVSGRLADVNDVPLPNLVVKIGEYKSRFVTDGGNYDYFYRFIDSTFTNQSGEYSIDFTSTGEGTVYKVMIENSPVEQNYRGSFEYVEVENIGGNFTCSSNSFLRLYPCDVTIHMNDINIFPIGIRHETTRNTTTLELVSNETYVKRIYIDKNSDQTLQFYRTKPDGTNQVANFIFQRSNSSNLTTQNITLNEADFQNF